jgi:hypothetical protein
MANTITIAADTSRFVAGVNQANQAMRGLGSTIQTAMGGNFIAAGIMQAMGQFLTLQGVIRAVTFAADGLRDALQLGDDLVDLNAQTGVAIDKLLELQMAFDLNGMKADQLQPVIAKLQRSIADAASGSDEAALKFARMGINIADIQGLTADEQLMKVGEAISKIQNPAARSAAAMDIFGKAGAKLLSVFASTAIQDTSTQLDAQNEMLLQNASGMDEVRAVLGKQSDMLLQNAGVFARASDILGLTGSKVHGFFVGIASETIPQMMDAMDRLAKIDLSEVGKSLGDGIAISIELIGRLIDKIRPFFEISEKLAKTQSTYGGQAFMGMGGMGMGGTGVSLSEATKTAEKPAPKTGFFDDIIADIEKKRAEARKKYATPEAAPTGMDIASKGVMSAAAPLIATSMAKVGAIGSAVWGGDQGINVQRDQLAVQRRIADSIDRFLQAAQPIQNPFLGNVTPQLGVI